MGKAKKQAKKAAPTRIPKDAEIATLYPDSFAELTLSYGKPHPNWITFAEFYKDSPVLQSDVVYALPDLLITSIVKKIPDFFSAEEQHFERDLTRLAGAGFFLKSPFSFPRLPHPVLSGEEATRLDHFDRRHATSARRIREMLEDGMQGSGRTTEEIKRYREAEHEEKWNIEIRQRAYAGWLVTNPEFRDNRGAFRIAWEPAIRELGGFPRLPLSLMGEKPSQPNKAYQDFYSDYKNFCVDWGLDGFATWDLPRPMRPELDSRSLYYLPAVQEAGVTAFVPWYLLRDKDIQLSELAERIRVLKGPEHLGDWLDHRPKDWGYDRFAVMLEIFIHLELCLKSRYAERLKRNVERLDRALGYYLSPGPDKEAGAESEAETIRKIRQAMNRRLKSCSVPAEGQ
jgi:hypothetical protein